MKFTNVFMAVSVIIAFSGLSFAQGGGADTGGAGDYGKIKIFSWYPRSNPSYCVEVAKDFGIQIAQAETVVDQAVAKWEQYTRNRTTPYWFDLKFIKSKVCSKTTNIRFALGQMPSGSSAELFAKAELDAYDSNAQIGTGTIWVRNEASLPNYMSWTRENNLLAVLIHEVGHTLGVEHINGTIMDEAISNWIMSANNQKTPKLIEEIDLRYELLPSSVTSDSNRICRKKRYVGLYDYSADTEPGGFNKAISELIGRAPKGEWRMTVDDECRSLTFKDALGEQKGAIEPIELVATFPSPGEIFASFDTTSFVAWGSVKSVRITMDNGRSAHALVRFNAQPSPFSIDLFEGGRKRPLFRAASPWEIQHETLDVRYGINYSLE